jgi:hypothetical protein
MNKQKTTDKNVSPGKLRIKLHAFALLRLGGKEPLFRSRSTLPDHEGLEGADSTHENPCPTLGTMLASRVGKQELRGWIPPRQAAPRREGNDSLRYLCFLASTK